MLETIRLWTWQEPRVYEALQRDGQVYVDPVKRPSGDGSHPYCYQWLVDHLPLVIPGYSGALPWWLHVQKPCRDEETDLLLEFEVPRDRAFLMPCWAWNQAFHGRFLPVSNAEWHRYRREFRRVLRRTGLDGEDRAGWLNTEQELIDDRRDMPAALHYLERLRRASCERLFAKGVIPAVAPRALRREFGGRRRTTMEAVVEVLEHSWLRSVCDPDGVR